MPEAEQAELMKAWGDWFLELGDPLVDGPNGTTFRAMTVNGDGAISEEPYLKIASGYLIIQADSFDHAVALAKGRPKLDGIAYLTVCKLMSRM